MRKITQKEMLLEGFLDTIRKAAGTAVGGAVGAVGSLAKDLIKGDTGANPFSSIVRGAHPGGKLGLKLSTSFKEKLRKLLEENGYYLVDSKGNSTQGSAEVAELKYDNKGKTIQGRKYTEPLIYSTKNGSLTIVKAPKKTFINTPNPTPAQPPITNNKPKFYESLRAWKIKNIGPSAATVGISYQQLKQFLQSINVQDPDRVLQRAGAEDKGSGVVSNIILGNIESTLKGRGIVAEKTQINLIKQLNLLNDSYKSINNTFYIK